VINQMIENNIEKSSKKKEKEIHVFLLKNKQIF
jgi:hypothetical protein